MFEDIRKKISGMVIFSSIKNDPAVSSLCEYFRLCDTDDMIGAAESYGEFVRYILISHCDGDFSEYLYRTLLTDDNIYVRCYFAGNTSLLDEQLIYELRLLTDLANNLPDEPIKGVVFPKILSSDIDLAEEYIKALPDAARRGVGLFGKASMFRVSDDGIPVPVKLYDMQRMSDLVGYERERRRVVENTKSLILGKPASNVLLYGDAGTGKSSTVKAILNEFAADGLRLIEFSTDQVHLIPDVLEMISAEPLKFIIFIDDLTLTADSPDLTSLKNVLEGGSVTRCKNAVIYVTSNHRHLVRQSTVDRNGDDVSIRDTLQGITGLSARFGITVTYLCPDKETYLNIVRHLMDEKNIPVTEDILSSAEAFAVRRGGRTPRCAKQFCDLVASGIDPIK